MRSVLLLPFFLFFLVVSVNTASAGVVPSSLTNGGDISIPTQRRKRKRKRKRLRVTPAVAEPNHNIDAVSPIAGRNEADTILFTETSNNTSNVTNIIDTCTTTGGELSTTRRKRKRRRRKRLPNKEIANKPSVVEEHFILDAIEDEGQIQQPSSVPVTTRPARRKKRKRKRRQSNQRRANVQDESISEEMSQDTTVFSISSMRSILETSPSLDHLLQQNVIGEEDGVTLPITEPLLHHQWVHHVIQSKQMREGTTENLLEAMNILGDSRMELDAMEHVTKRKFVSKLKYANSRDEEEQDPLTYNMEDTIRRLKEEGELMGRPPQELSLASDALWSTLGNTRTSGSAWLPDSMGNTNMETTQQIYSTTSTILRSLGPSQLSLSKEASSLVIMTGAAATTHETKTMVTDETDIFMTLEKDENHSHVEKDVSVTTTNATQSSTKTKTTTAINDGKKEKRHQQETITRKVTTTRVKKRIVLPPEQGGREGECLRRIKREWRDAVKLGIAYDWVQKKSISSSQQTTKIPHQDVRIGPLGKHLLRWHFSVAGPEHSVYEGGIYHGRVLLPKDYPGSPPRIQVLTPTGRFVTGEDICLSASAFHPETWTPRWTVSSLVDALRMHMLTTANEIGGMHGSDELRRQLARQSRTWHAGIINHAHMVQEGIFPWTDPDQVKDSPTSTKSTITPISMHSQEIDSDDTTDSKKTMTKESDSTPGEGIDTIRGDSDDSIPHLVLEKKKMSHHNRVQRRPRQTAAQVVLRTILRIMTSPTRVALVVFFFIFLKLNS